MEKENEEIRMGQGKELNQKVLSAGDGLQPDSPGISGARVVSQSWPCCEVQGPAFFAALSVPHWLQTVGCGRWRGVHNISDKIALA